MEHIHKEFLKEQSWGGREVSHQGRVCATKPDDLSSTPTSPILKTADFHKMFSTYIYAGVCAHTDTYE